MDSGHVNLGNYAPTGVATAPVAAYQGPSAHMGQSPSAPMEQRRKSSGCRRRRMGRAGTRCFCNGKLVKGGRCK